MNIKRCDEIHCTSPAPDEEIDLVIANTLLLVRSNARSFNAEGYGQDTVKKHSNLLFSQLNSKQNLDFYFRVLQ